MLRKIVEIDEAKCDGCGDCVPSCAEGAIAIVGGKARLVGDVLCDGLGACLGECPRGAIKVVERERAGVRRGGGEGPPRAVASTHRAARAAAPRPGRPLLAVLPSAGPTPGGGCPGSRPMTLPRDATTGARRAGRRPEPPRPVAGAAPPRPGPRALLRGRRPAGRRGLRALRVRPVPRRPPRGARRGDGVPEAGRRRAVRGEAGRHRRAGRRQERHRRADGGPVLRRDLRGSRATPSPRRGASCRSAR